MKASGEAPEMGIGIDSRRSDAALWSERVTRFAPYVAAMARAHDLAEHEAADLFEEVFMRLWLTAGRTADDEAVRETVVALTRELATDRLGGAEAPPEERLDELHDALVISEATRRLPAMQREILRRRYVEGEDAADIAADLGLGEDAFEEQLRRARRRLRGRLRGECRRETFRASER